MRVNIFSLYVFKHVALKTVCWHLIQFAFYGTCILFWYTNTLSGSLWPRKQINYPSFIFPSFPKPWLFHAMRGQHIAQWSCVDIFPKAREDLAESKKLGAGAGTLGLWQQSHYTKIVKGQLYPMICLQAYLTDVVSQRSAYCRKC